MSFNARFTQIMLGLVLLLAGLAVGTSQIAAIMMMVGLFLIVRQVTSTRLDPPRNRQRPPARRREEPLFRETNIPSATRRASVSQRLSDSVARRIDARVPPPVQPPDDVPRRHALEAAQAAGQNPRSMRVVPVDIGVMTFRGDQDPEVARSQPIPDDVDYLQPFVQLNLPTRAVGNIRFEIVDSEGETRFLREENYQLQRGLNLLTPAARLPIHDAFVLSDDWQLRISADGMLLAVHHFTWEESANKLLRKHIQEDGELSHELRAMMAENRLGRVSLDDLLADQAAPETDEQRRQQKG